MSIKMIIPIEVFSVDVEVVITDDVSDAIEKLDKENKDKNNIYADTISGFDAAFSFYCNQYKDGMIYKRVGMIISEDADDEMVIHECLHTAWHVLEHKCIDVSRNNHEMLAYLQGFLYNKVKAKLLKL